MNLRDEYRQLASEVEYQETYGVWPHEINQAKRKLENLKNRINFFADMYKLLKTFAPEGMDNTEFDRFYNSRIKLEGESNEHSLVRLRAWLLTHPKLSAEKKEQLRQIELVYKPTEDEKKRHLENLQYRQMIEDRIQQVLENVSDRRLALELYNTLDAGPKNESKIDLWVSVCSRNNLLPARFVFQDRVKRIAQNVKDLF